MKRILFEEMDQEQQAAVMDYLYDLDEPWASAESCFERVSVQLARLEDATRRPLLLEWLDQELVGNTCSAGKPIIVDDDFSVIDGMHRIADAVAGNVSCIEAWQRVSRR